MKLAHVIIRNEPHYRYDAFVTGLKRLGYALHHNPAKCDAIVSWNRHGHRDAICANVASHGGKVVIVENGYLGNDVAGDRWYSISRDQHNGAGSWPSGDGSRWKAMGVRLEPFRQKEGPLLLLPQRGIGPPNVAMPRDWVQRVTPKLKQLGVQTRTRAHPGVLTRVPTLESDLDACSAVLTWGSGAAVKALALGVPVYYDFSKWVMASSCRSFSQFEKGPVCDEHARLRAFERMAWSQWRVSEIADGSALSRTLEH